ncbi:MAG: ATP-binding cassette domain-containing protein, partial [Firmicutes bacterium]|nr:ATP-binding cassette domain-containing protein [Bacillota bacterium]
GREFDGFELSGGQWQRIAISRGIYRDSSIIIFDEPTAALDPIIEYEIFKNFLNAANNQCTILVSHRIGTAQFVDRIIVLKDGEIVQVGKHEELIKQKGEYSTLFHMQAKWYV